ncbi:MAG: hemolysin family protein [Planctomycetota bacterium]
MGDGWPIHVIWVAAFVITWVLSVWQRVLAETPFSAFYQRFEAWGKAEETAAERLRRIRLLNGMLLNVSRVAWILLFARAWLGGGAALEWPRVGVVCGVVALLSVLVLDLTPQVVSLWKGEQIAMGSLRTLCAIETLLSPLSRGARWLVRSALGVLGARGDRSDADMIEEGILAAVEQGERHGVLVGDEKSMIESVLEFHDVEVREVMTPRTAMVAVEAGTTVEEMIQRAIACGHSRIPVYRENIDDIVGIVYTKDLLRYVSDAKQSQLRVEDIYRKIYFVPETKKIKELLAEFRAERFHIAVVLDEYGGTTGLVTIEDIIEELVGDIEDEYDTAGAALIRRVDQDTFDLDGRAHIDEVSKALDVELPESDDYETIAGFVFSSLGKVPKEGDHFDLDQLRFKVTAADERKIKRVRVQLMRVQGQEVA